MDLSSVLSCFGLTLILALIIELVQLPTISAEYPGVIELVGYSNRRARTHYIPTMYSAASSRQFGGDSTATPPAAKIQADIETVKQNIEKYNKLLTLDTKNLPESQKDMLERIVERVARLKETLDIEDQRTNTSNSNSSNSNSYKQTTTSPTTTAATIIMETETDPTIVLDETTLFHLQTSMDELAAAQQAETIRTHDMTTPTPTPTTTEINSLETDKDDVSDEYDVTSQEFISTTIVPQTDATNSDEQFVAARANNNIAAITAAVDDTSATLSTSAASQQRTLTTSGKLSKTRATKRPAGVGAVAGAGSTQKTTSTHSKRVQRPNQQSTAGLHKQTTTKHKLAAAAAAAGATTTQPLQYTKSKQQHKQQLLQQQQQHYQQQKVSIADKAAAVTPATYGAAEQRTSPSTVAAAAYGSTSSISSSSSSSTNGYNDMVYDEHVNTSAIIDSLSNVREEFYQQKHTVNNKDKKPSSATAKPTKYHYYPHNQHIYLLPECAIQQVCNAVYVRLNYTQPLCACPSRYRDPCSASLNEDDQHTTKLVGDGKKKAITLAKTCEATTEMRDCRSPKDWSLLALQNTRTGKSHYLVICRCPDHYKMEGPMAHDQPSYAAVPGIRVFGMMCVKAGHSVRKPQIQPPKRYYLQKPFHRPNTQTGFINNNQYGGSIGGGSSSSQTGFTKENYGRPTYNVGSSTSAFSNNGNINNNNNYQQSSSSLQQHQQQPSYQYLNRPESIHSSSSNSYRPDTLSSINNFPGAGSIYGRNNERQGEAPIEAQPAAPATLPDPAAVVSDEEDGKILISTSTQPTEEARTTLTSDEHSMNNSNNNNNNNNNNKSEELASTTANNNNNSNNEESKPREKRSLVDENFIEGFDNEDLPEFPWDRVIEFQKTIHWD